jgi:hypothetical protein
MLYWIYDMPTWKLVALCCAFFVGVTWLGILFVRPIIRAVLGRHSGLNDSVGYLLGAHGVYLGVLLGLLAVAAYQNYSGVEGIVGNEATKLAGLYRDVTTYPEPYRGKLTGILRLYAEYVIKEAWPLQKKGLIPTKGTKIVNEFEKELLKFEPQTITQQIMHTETIHQLNAFSEARRARLEAVTTGIPALLWVVVILGAAVAIFLMWILDMKLMSHFVLSGVVSFYLATLIALVAAMDNPFRGEVSVEPEAFQVVLDTVMAPEPPAGGSGGTGNPPTAADAAGSPAAGKEPSLKAILAKPDAGHVPPAAKEQAEPAAKKAATPAAPTRPDASAAPDATKGAPEALKKDESLKAILSKPDAGYAPPAAKEGGAPASAKPATPAAPTRPETPTTPPAAKGAGEPGAVPRSGGDPAVEPRAA